MRPILCNYYVTYRCNTRCQFCDIWQNSKYLSTPDCLLDDVITNLHQLKEIGVKFIDFTGGEPLLHKDLPQMLDDAKRLGFYTSVTTNCVLYPKVAQEITSKVDLLHFSIDSLNAQQNDTLRGGSIFNRVMKSIDVALRLGEKPDLLYTVTSSNYRALDALSKFAASNKLILIVNPIFKYTNQQPLSENILNYVERFQTRPYVYINHAFHLLIRNGGNERKRPRCRAISSTVVISPNNELLLPCFHHIRFKIPIQSNLLNIIKSTPYQRIKKKQGHYPFCQKCTINCYFDPSFLYKLDRYCLMSLISKAKYGFDKYVRRN